MSIPSPWRICAEMLTPGDPLTHWQVAGLCEARYDVPDAPMDGEMDSLFFLTKDKNVIPHTYPCRTAYRHEVKGKKPHPAAPPDWAGARNVLPFGAPLLDLSGFWFRATRITGWARTAIEAEAAGQASLRLGTCGAALVFVNGQEAGWLAPASRNAMDEAEITLALREGHNEITLWFDDLAERDARVLVALSWVSGPPARAALPYDAPEAAVRAVEALLASAHFEAPHIDGDEVALALPTPLSGPAELRVQIAGDFMSHDPQSRDLALDAGQTRLVLGHSFEFPADYRHFTLSVTYQGFTAARTFACEISHRAAQGTPPATLEGRISETLAWIAAHSEADTVTALACLDRKETARAEAMIARTLPTIEECWDCADFALVPLLWARARYADQLSAPLLARIDCAILGYRYWMDEPGNDVQWYFSENHALLFHTAAYLAGHLLPDQVFTRSWRRGCEQHRIGRKRVREWLDHFEAAEMAEFNSAPYFPIDLKGLTSLFALAPDQDIRDRAGRGIARLIEIVANSAHHGIVTAAQGRSYEHTLCAGETLELSGLARLVWGRGAVGARVHCLPQLALCLRDHGLRLPDLAPRACWAGDDAQEWTFWQGQDAFARLYHYKTKATAMGSAALYRWGDWGYQETLIHARLGENPQAQIWINQPGELIHAGYGRPSYWGGSASVPRVQQYRNLAILRFDGVSPQPDLTHCWFPTMAFDEWQLDGPRAAARSGRGLVALRASGDLALTQQGPASGVELTLPGRQALWVLRLAEGEDLAAFAAAHSLTAHEAADGTITVTDPEYGPVTFAADGTVSAEGRSLDPRDWTREGQRVILPPGALRPGPTAGETSGKIMENLGGKP